MADKVLDLTEKTDVGMPKCDDRGHVIKTRLNDDGLVSAGIYHCVHCQVELTVDEDFEPE